MPYNISGFLRTFLTFLIFSSISLSSEGFAPGTLVKTAGGYTPIEYVKVDDWVACYDGNGELILSPVIAIKKQKSFAGILLFFDETYVFCAPDQQLYHAEQDTWLKAAYLQRGDFLLEHGNYITQLLDVNCIETDTYFYDLALQKHHHFLVTRENVVAHNFFIVLPLVTWGAGAVTFFEGITLTGIGTAAAYGLFEYVTGKKVTVTIGTDGGVNGHRPLGEHTTQTNNHITLFSDLSITASSSNTNDSDSGKFCYCGCGPCNQGCGCGCECVCKSKKRVPQSDYTYVNGKYEDAGYHHHNSTGGSQGGKSPAPNNGQRALDNSYKVRGNSNRRIAISDGQFVVFDLTLRGITRSQDIYHGHVRTWEEICDNPDPKIKNTFLENNLVNIRGKIL